MSKMDRIDFKSGKIWFGNVLKETPEETFMDVKFPQEVGVGEATVKNFEIKAITHGVYVPEKYRTIKSMLNKTKRRK